ncbi:F-box only protein 39-like isoform X3 [Biomphalaria pfeifferi]|uniref:F-box only protein 39-like isoform X3 n=1 Tax=Biomphalaria pfeifferi TaxID=112525 RepID=A0AAD8AXH8_BIOPF|nr:F-box only protein 39-like isoform X3 [Biomphalaria pfeifferi]
MVSTADDELILRDEGPKPHKRKWFSNDGSLNNVGRYIAETIELLPKMTDENNEPGTGDQLEHKNEHGTGDQLENKNEHGTGDQLEDKNEHGTGDQLEDKNEHGTGDQLEDKNELCDQIEEKNIHCFDQAPFFRNPYLGPDDHKAVSKVLSVCLKDVCRKDVCLKDVSEVDISGMRRKRKPLEVDDVIIQKMRKLELQQTSERKVLKRKKTPCDWAQLPDGALGLIYEMVSHRDRLSMSNACKHWHEAFTESEKWTTLTFRINASMPMRALDFTKRKIPSEIKHLIIDCKDPKATDSSGDSKLLLILRHLLEQKANKLVTLQLLNVSRMTNNWKQDSRHKDVVMCIRGLSHFQCELKELHLTNAGLDLEQGTVVLKKVGNSCGAKIATLYIDGLFHCTEETSPEDISLALLQGLGSFTKIQTLSLTDFYLAERIMEFLSNQAHLKCLYLESLDQDLSSVTNQSLLKLKALCPKLKIRREEDEIEFCPEDQEAEVTVDTPAETPEMKEHLESCEDLRTPFVGNLQNHHEPQDMQNHHDPQDMKNHHTPQELQNHHTPQELQSHHTPKDLQNHHTTEDLQDHHTPQGTHELIQDSETVVQGSQPRYNLRRRSAKLNYRV